MCGICGQWSAATEGAPRVVEEGFTAMVRAIQHRGPDASGTWAAANNRTLLGHARLAVRGLGASGAQPMLSRSGQTVIVYNGEVYTHTQLQGRLSSVGVTPRGTSDTELIVEHIEAFGLDTTLQYMNGMFAFAVYNAATHEISLVRDRLGVKPLYYSFDGQVLTFGSEIDAVLAGSQVQPTISRLAVAEMLTRAAIPSPLTIFDRVRQLQPGHVMSVSKDGELTSWQYWALRNHVVGEAGWLHDEAGVDDAHARLTAAVERCLVSDVPIGVLLSGGIDSSLVAALATSVSAGPIVTFSLGFDDPSFDESGHAHAIARHLGTRHTTLKVTAQDVLSLVTDLPSVYSEPFADSSQLPMLALSRLVRKQLPVVLTGDGGDESFAGYDRHVVGGQILERAATLPRWGRRLMASTARQAPIPLVQGVARTLGFSVNTRSMDAKLRRVAAALGLLEDPWRAYQRIAGHWTAAAGLVIGAGASLRPCKADLLAVSALPWPERIQFLDSIGYLPDDLLVKVDRATMSVGLEARVPLLDHEIVEWAWSLPRQAKVRNGRGKWVLREVLSRHIPQQLFERPKQGFAVPLDEWLRGPLHAWAAELLEPAHLKRQGLLEHAPVTALWQQHQLGASHGSKLWAILMLQAWLRERPSVGL